MMLFHESYGVLSVVGDVNNWRKGNDDPNRVTAINVRNIPLH